MNKQSGFTLIELLVVIAIIGVLTAVVLANMVGIRERSRDAALKNDVKQLKTALRLYYNDNQSYPAGTDVACESISGLTDAHMKDIPTQDETGCTYSQDSAGENFIVSVELNNEGDPDAEESAERCDQTFITGIYYECAE